MPVLLLGLVALVVGLWVLNVISKTDPRTGARVVKAAGGVVALGFAAFLGLRGEIGIAIPLGAFGLGLLGWLPFGPAGFSQRTRKTGGQTSRVRSAWLDLQLDHDTGAMQGTVLQGPYAGTDLDRLDLKTVAALVAEVDDESRALLLAYLDRRDAGWREHAQGDAAAGRGRASSGKMTEEEAYQILGLQPGATADDIGRAHRALMKKLHPDQGGSTYLAARVNEAKDVLLRRH
jgi:DnaJ domain